MAIAFISIGWRVVRCSYAIHKPHHRPPSNAGRLMTLMMRVKAKRLHTAISVKTPRRSLATLGICSSSRPVFSDLRSPKLTFDDGEIGRRRLFAVAHGPRLYLFRLAPCPLITATSLRGASRPFLPLRRATRFLALDGALR